MGVCAAGLAPACSGAGAGVHPSPDLGAACVPRPEICDGADNDCDGVVDEAPAANDDCAALRGPAFACFGGACACADRCGGVCTDLQGDDANCGACGKACAAAEACLAGRCESVQMRQFVVRQLVLPTRVTDYAFDLNGDGDGDNGVAAILPRFRALGRYPEYGNPAATIDHQRHLDDAVNRGDFVLLLELRAHDPRAPAIADLHVRLFRGHPKGGGAPDFSGQGPFTVDRQIASAAFRGPVVAASFSSLDPVAASAPVMAPLALPALVTSDETIPLVSLPLHGAHLALRMQGDGLAGQLHGTFLETEFDGAMIPAIAPGLSARCSRWPECYLSIDFGGCTDDKGQPAVPGDGVLAPCEIAASDFYRRSTPPDVQILDDNGLYAPAAANFRRDSISLGLAFTAVPAQF